MNEIQQLQPAREKVDRLERALMDVPQVDCPIRHHFAPGVYAREISIPAGVTVVGVVHKLDNLVILSKGTIRVATEDGHIEMTAPHTMLCKAGAKNAVYAVTDVVWTNFFATTETDTDKLVEILTEAKASDLIGGKNNKQLAANKAAQALEN